MHGYVKLPCWAWRSEKYTWKSPIDWEEFINALLGQAGNKLSTLILGPNEIKKDVFCWGKTKSIAFDVKFAHAIAKSPTMSNGIMETSNSPKNKNFLLGVAPQ